MWLLPVSSVRRKLLRQHYTTEHKEQYGERGRRKVFQSQSVRGRKLVKNKYWSCCFLSHRRCQIQWGDFVPLVFTCVSGLLVSVPMEFPTLLCICDSHFSRGWEFPGMLCIGSYVFCILLMVRGMSVWNLCVTKLWTEFGHVFFQSQYKGNKEVLSLIHTYCVNVFTKTT